MMRPGLARLVRRAAPHRSLALAVLGAVLGGYGSATPTAVPVVAAVLVLIVLATTALRMWDTTEGAQRPAQASAMLVLAGVGVGGAASVLVMTGNWLAFVALLGVAASEWATYLPPFETGRQLVIEPSVVAAEGFLMPLLAMLVAAPAHGVRWGALGVTAALALGFASAGLLQSGSDESVALRSSAAFVSPMGAALLALTGFSTAIALTLAGGGLGLRPELALLATPVAVMAAVFGWLALADPRPEARYRRVECLVVGGGMALVVGIAVVVLFA